MNESSQPQRPFLPADLPASARLAATARSLKPNQYKVAQFAMENLEMVVDMTAQEVSEKVGVGRATVVRTAQALGYDGFPQFRVALAREIPQAQNHAEGIAAAAAAVAANLQSLVIDQEEVDRIAGLLSRAHNVLVVAHGMSAPLGTTLVARLVSVGISAMMHADHTTADIAAAGLSKDSVCVAISGSGVNKPTLRTAAFAHKAGAKVVALTSFSSTPLIEIAHHSLIVPKAYSSFRDEIYHASRVELLFICEQLAARTTPSTSLKTDPIDIVSEGLRE